MLNHYKDSNAEAITLDAPPTTVSVNKYHNDGRGGSGNSGGYYRRGGRGRGAAPARGARQPYQSKHTDQPNRSDQPNRPADFHNDNAAKHNSKPTSNYNKYNKKRHNNYRSAQECTYCGKSNHEKSTCYKFLDSQKSQKVNKSSMESLDGNMKKTEVQFNMFKASVSNKNAQSAESMLPAVDSVKSSSVVDNTFMAGVHVHNICKCLMEIDTAADKSTLSYDRYATLLQKC